MDNNRFFKIVWRTNAILMLLALVVVSSTSAYTQIRRWLYKPVYDGFSNFTTVSTDERTGDTTETRWTYGIVEEVPGRSGGIISLSSQRGPYRRIRNLLFVDKDLGSQWVFPHNDNVIWSHEFLVAGDDGEVAAIMYSISDTYAVSECDDDWCEESSEPAIYLSRPDGSDLTRILAEFTRQIGQSVTDENHLMVFYVKDEQVHAAKVSLTDFAVVQTKALSPVN